MVKEVNIELLKQEYNNISWHEGFSYESSTVSTDFNLEDDDLLFLDKYFGIIKIEDKSISWYLYRKSFIKIDLRLKKDNNNNNNYDELNKILFKLPKANKLNYRLYRFYCLLFSLVFPIYIRIYKTIIILIALFLKYLL